MAKSELELNKEKIMEAMSSMKKKAEEKGYPMIADFGSEIGELLEIQKVLTGVPNLDILTKGGICRGRITEIWGPESSGKTAVALIICAAFLKAFPDLCVVYSNNERTFDKVWCEILFSFFNMKISDGRFIYNEAATLQDSLNFCIAMAKTKAVSCMVIDSIVGIASRAEFENKKGDRDLDDNTIAEVPRVLSQFFRMGVAPLSTSKMALICTNQVRTQGIGGNPAGIRDGQSGGHALKHYKGTSLYFRRAGKDESPVDTDGKPIGFATVAKVTKDKSGVVEGSEALLPFISSKGFITDYSIINAALTSGLIQRAGSSYTFELENKGGHKVVGKENIFKYILDNSLLDALREELYKRYVINTSGTVVEEESNAVKDEGVKNGPVESKEKTRRDKKGNK